MADKIESYNASYPAAFYEVGKVYSFYGSMSSTGNPASSEYISRYSSALKSLETKQKSNAIQPVKSEKSKTSNGIGGLTRYYAVVVSKSATNIEIMFLNDDKGRECYLTRKYAVSKSCHTDGKDLMPPKTKTNVSGAHEDIQKIGGITRVQDNGGNGKVGGVTKAGHTSTTFANVGGITKVHNNDTNGKVGGVNKPEQTIMTSTNVGGITRMKK